MHGPWLALLPLLIGMLFVLLSSGRSDDLAPPTPHAVRPDPPSPRVTTFDGQGAAPAETPTGSDAEATRVATEIARLAAAYAPEREAPPALRGVKGVVCDAQTKRPIEGAWVTWRVPPPDVVEQVLGNPAFGFARSGMITDRQGRFAVDRLPDDVPVSHQLCVVAADYSYRVVSVGLREQLVIELERGGGLEIELQGFSTPTRVLIEGTIDLALIVASGRVRVPHLAPGTYEVGVDVDRLGEWRTVVIEAGRTARLTLRTEGLVRFSGTLAGPSRLLPHTRVRFEDPTLHRVFQAQTDASGEFVVELPPKQVFVAHVLERRSERFLHEVETVPGTRLELQLRERGPLTRLTLRREGRALESAALGLVSWNPPESGGWTEAMLHLEPTETPGEYAAEVPPNDYLLFDGLAYCGVALTLPADAGRPLDLPPLQPWRVEWQLPDGLRDDEVVRGEVSVLPAGLMRAGYLLNRFAAQSRRSFTARRGASSMSFEYAGPGGRFSITGTSDLGAFEHLQDMEHGTLAFVPLASD